jgi:hypothetical protein
MKKSITITLSDEELIELERIMIDDDLEGALRFLKRHIGERARGALDGKGHCKPCFELPGRSAIPDEFRKL